MAILTTVTMELPDEMISLVTSQDKEEQLLRNAMMLYPYIWQERISLGRAAEILSVFKMDLIVLYGKMGLSYIVMSDEEINEELKTVSYLKEVIA